MNFIRHLVNKPIYTKNVDQNWLKGLQTIYNKINTVEGNRSDNPEELKPHELGVEPNNQEDNNDEEFFITLNDSEEKFEQSLTKSQSNIDNNQN